MLIGEGLSYCGVQPDKYQRNTHVQIFRRNIKMPKYCCVLKKEWGICFDNGDFQFVGKSRIVGWGESVNAAGADLVANASLGGIDRWQFEAPLASAIEQALANEAEMMGV